MADEEKTPAEELNAKLKRRHSFRLGEGRQGAGEDPPPDRGGQDGQRQAAEEALTARALAMFGVSLSELRKYGD